MPETVDGHCGSILETVLYAFVLGDTQPCRTAFGSIGASSITNVVFTEAIFTSNNLRMATE